MARYSRRVSYDAEAPVEALGAVASTAPRRDEAKYLVERIGLNAMVALLPRIPDGTCLTGIEGSAGAPLPAVRREWLAALGVPDDGGEPRSAGN